MTSATRPEQRTPRVQVLEVILDDREVGTITNLPGDRSLFAFADDYVRDAARHVLSLSFKTVDGGVDAPRRPTRRRVPAFFSNLLPEGHLREYLAGRAHVNPAREFPLLWVLGRDLPGGVLVRSADGEELPPADAAHGSDRGTLEGLLRFSLAGIQLKFSAVLEATGGLTIPANGVGGSWIVKLPSPRYPAVPETEFAMMELARSVGLDVPDVMLVDPTDLTNIPTGTAELGNAIAVRRFDRAEGGKRIHIEDFAQVFALFPSRKYERASYEDVARVLWAESGLDDVVEFAKRLAFSALTGNADMHLKNWSVIYRDGVTARLAPAYDFVATIAYLGDADMALSLGTVKSMYDVSLETFKRFAGKAGVPERPVVEGVKEVTERVLTAWPRHPALQAVPAELRKRVTEHMERVPLRT